MLDRILAEKEKASSPVVKTHNKNCIHNGYLMDHSDCLHNILCRYTCDDNNSEIRSDPIYSLDSFWVSIVLFYSFGMGTIIMACGCNSCEDLGDGPKVYQYAAKVVIGAISKGAKGKSLPVGAYFTKINIHNFDRCDCVAFRWKVAVGHPHLKIGPVTGYQSATLCADEALEIDSSDIFARVNVDPRVWTETEPSGRKIPGGGTIEVELPRPKALKHLEGWVVIESPVELDVVAVYGAAAEADGPVKTFHTERVSPRCMRPCGDFLLDISTGVSAWEYKGPSDPAFTVATLSQKRLEWADPQAGSLWVVPGSERKPGDYVFRLPFKLCFGFTDPVFEFGLMADDYANVFVNGAHLPPFKTSGTMFNAVTHYSAGQHLKGGDNEIQIVVHNSGRENNPVGLDLHGSLFAHGGLCEGFVMPLLPCPKICYRIRDREFWFNPFIGFAIDRDQQVWNSVCDGATCGSTNRRRRAEQFEASLSGSIPPGTSIEYSVYTRSISGPTGWTNPYTSAGFAGTPGNDHPITGLRIRLVNAPVNCHVEYRIFKREQLVNQGINPSWGPWVRDDAIAGSDYGFGTPQRFEPIIAVEARIV